MCRSDGPGGAEAHRGVKVMAGDVTRPSWGLPPADLARVTRSTDVILHCAADTSFLSRDSVRDTNIVGTRRLIELARRCERRPLIVYMSTATNMGKAEHRCLAEDEGCRPDNEHHNEYTRSKAVAEALLRDSGLPVLTLRPTIVFSAGIPDREFAQNIMWFVPLMRRFTALPLDAASRLDLVPISFVVEATLDLLRKSRLAFDCYHLSAGRRHATPLQEAADVFHGHYRRRTPLRLIPPAEWTRQDYRTYVATKLQRKIFYGMRYYLPFLNMDVTYDNARLEAELGDQSHRIRPLREYMGDILDQISSRSALVEMARP
jgi:nucleoside-diphosphate-sugar epimerase